MGRLNFGQSNDVRAPQDYPAAAAIAFKNTGGKFVTISTSGKIALAVETAKAIIGWAQVAEFTCAANDKITVNTARDAIYEMPIDVAKTEAELIALLGQCCDIDVVGGIQYADLDASTDDTLQIVGYHYYGSALGEQTALVRINTYTVDYYFSQSLGVA
jgi:hypothetical protein